MFLHAIKGNYYANLLATPKSNNFSQTLPAPVADYANEVFRSRYNLGFLGVTEPMKELKLERRLVNKITRFILELGKGFTFIGNQHILPFNGKEYKVDMLFFHRGLHRMKSHPSGSSFAPKRTIWMSRSPFRISESQSALRNINTCCPRRKSSRLFLPR